ncbi:alpha/beta hydrolase [Sphingobium sp.]|uniref:alpha/beta fold hydrolase n=1 Tax=Sphingobium sp. TaxID=1912891 RepID=UPI002C225907|nr:alpha/beta hydrolase [Sphingobium sp.]HUD90844.1 alpha/beta hydrolase [Sphingobium sp.]
MKINRMAALPRWSAMCVIAVLLFLAGGTTALFWGRAKVQDFIVLLNRVPPDKGVADSRYVVIGGVRQWLQIRGQDTENPILLYVHGGPGDASSPLSWVTQRPWEDYFTVVQWDQRGAGLSGEIDRDKWNGTVTKEQIVSDTIEVIEYLRKRFNKRKIILLGHSWGTIPASIVAQERPDLVSLLVNMGVVVGWHANYERRHAEVLAEARQRNDKAVISAIESHSTIPDPHDLEQYQAWMGASRKAMCDWGHCFYLFDRKDITAAFTTAGFISPYISTGDLLYAFGQPLTGWLAPRPTPTPKELFVSIDQVDLRRDLSLHFEMPVLYVMGAHDLQTPTSLAREYVATVTAPQKTFVVFDRASHALITEVPGKLLVTLVDAATRAGAFDVDKPASAP